MINLASGVRWERLTPGSDRDVEFLYVVYPVGAASCPEDALMTHGGKEYGYVTSGTLGVQVGFEKYELGPGGSIAFNSSSPHRLWAIGDEPVHAVWVVIGREADPRDDDACRRRARRVGPRVSPPCASPSPVRRRPTPALLVRSRREARGSGRARAPAGSARRW